MAIPAFDLSVSLIVAMSFSLYGTGLLNPIFLQELMGYTAWRAGLVLAPRGLGTMVSMLLIGQLARFKFDTRPLVGRGLRPDGDVAVDDVEVESQREHLGGRLAEHHDGHRDGIHLPDAVCGDALGRQSRADGLCGEPVQHDAQHGRRDRHFLHDDHAGESSADSSVVPGRAFLGVRRMADEQRGAADGGRARLRVSCRS